MAFFDCKLDGANFRMTTWERAEFHDCDLAAGDFYGAKLPASRFLGCDLRRVELSKSVLAGSRLQRSRIEQVRGADCLRGVSIGSDQIVPVALAVFSSLGVTIEDDDLKAPVVLLGLRQQPQRRKEQPQSVLGRRPARRGDHRHRAREACRS